jgi:hypothetical protein
MTFLMTYFGYYLLKKKPILEKLITFAQPKNSNILIIIIVLFLFKNALTQKGPASY